MKPSQLQIVSGSLRLADVFLVLAGSIGVAAGLQESGAMQALASGLVTLGK